MDMYSEIDSVYQRALVIQQRASESPMHPELVDAALDELRFVLEELQATHLELRRQNNELVATRLAADWERQRYQALFELAPDGYLVTDRKGKISNANQTAAQLFSMSQEYLINMPLIVLIHASDRLDFHDRLVNFNPDRKWSVAINTPTGAAKSASIAVRKISEHPEEDDPRDMLLWLFRERTSA